MSTQLLAIMVVLMLALGVLFLAWVALAACQVSSRISRHEEWKELLASAKGDYLADEDNEA